MFRGIEGFKEDASWGKGVKSVLAPFAAIMQQHNIDPMVQIGGLMNAHYSLATGSPQAKADLIAKLLVDYKVDPTLVKVGDAPGEAPYVDPEVKALRESVQALQSTEATRQKENETRVRAELATKIDSFFADPANTYINEVGHDMARLIDSGLAKDTADAYQQAIWLNPAVRAKEQARITTEAATKVETERAAKAEAARKASAANVNARAKSGSTAAPLGTMEDTMMATLRDIKTR